MIGDFTPSGTKKAVEAKLVDKFPPFPDISEAESTSTNATTMSKLKGELSKYLGELLKNVKDSEAFLNHELVDKLFKIKDNVQDELDTSQFQEAYQDVVNASMRAGDASVPLTQEEMELADDAGTLLITFIRGDGTTKALSIYDEKVQDLHSVCLSVIPRLKASQDLDNPNVDPALVPHALDVLEHLENALTVYNDSLNMEQEKAGMGFRPQY